MKQRLVSALVAIVLVLLAGCRGNLFPGMTEAATSQGITFVSKQAPLMVSFQTGWQQRQPQVEKAIKVFLDKQNLDYKKDIQPWLGSEITLAITDLDFDHETSNGVQPGYLFIATTKDGDKSREFLQTWLSQQLIAGTELAFAPYKGTQLIYPQVANSGSSADKSVSEISGGEISSTVVGDRFVLIANHPQVLRQAINNAQAVDLNLASSSSYKQTMGSLEQSKLGRGFINLPALTAWLGKHGELDQEPPFASLAIALSSQNKGLVATTALVTGNPEISPNINLKENADSNPEEQPASLSADSPAINYLPAGSGLTIKGTDLQDFMAQHLGTENNHNLLITWLDNLLEKVESQSQLDFSQDILPWLTGDYALGWLPSQDSGANSQKNSSPGDWIFVTDRSNPQAEAAIARLDKLATDQGFSLTPLKLAQQPVTLWTQLQTQTNSQGLKDVDTLVRGVHTRIKDYEIFSSSIPAMGAALGLGSQPLAKDADFQGAIAPLSTPNQGYIYLDWQTARPLLESQFPLLRLLEVPLNPLLENLGTISFTSYGSKAGITSSELFFNFQKSSD